MPEWIPPVLESGRSLRAHLPVQQWIEVGHQLLARHDLAEDSLEMFASGSDVVLGGETLVVKLTMPRCRTQIDREREWNEWLDGRLPVQIAPVVAHGLLSDWPYLITRRLAGTSVADVWPTLPDDSRRQLAADLGELMAQLHAVELLPGYADRWPAFMAERRATLESRQRSMNAPEPLLAEALTWVDTIPRPERPLVDLHTELLGHHVLLERTDRWRPSALIDLADAEVGHPDYDIPALVEFVFRGQPGCLDACLGAYGWTSEERSASGSRRVAAWALLHRFASIPRMVEAVGDPLPRDLSELATRLYRM